MPSQAINGTLHIQILMTIIESYQIFTAVGRGWFPLHKSGSFVVASRITFIYFVNAVCFALMDQVLTQTALSAVLVRTTNTAVRKQAQ